MTDSRDPTVKRLRNQVLDEIRTFQWSLARLEAFDYSNSAPEVLINELRKEIENEKNTLVAFLDFNANPERAAQIIISSHRKIAARIPFLGYIERAQTRHTPWSLIDSIQELAREIIPEYRVIIASVDAHNYLVEWYPRTKRLFLWLPRLHRLNALWHTCVGHELFHPALYPFFDEHRPKIARLITDACKRFLSQHGLSTDDSNLFDRDRLDMVVGETLKIWEKGLSEILCDFGCATIFGPAAMMALLSMAQCDDLDTSPAPPLYYPPWRFRLRLVYDRIAGDVDSFVKESLSGSQYSSAFKNTFDTYKAVVTDESDRKEIEKHALCMIAYGQITELLDAGWRFVRDLVPSKVKCWTSTQEQVPALLDRLVAGIPPSEVVRPVNQRLPEAADLSAILVAGWIFESFWQQQPDNDHKYDYSTFMRLLLKGCEDAALRRAYQKRSKKDGGR